MDKRIIVTSDETITCPSCGHEFPLHEGITRQTIERYEQEFDALLAGERKTLREELEKEATRHAARTFEGRLEALKEQLQDSQQAYAKMQLQLNEAKAKAAADARAEAAAQTTALKEEVETKNKQLADYRQQEVALRQEKKRLEEARQELEIQLQRRLDEEKKRLEEQVAEQFRLREAEYKKKIEDAQKANDALKRKLEQGSQQLQGEVLELELESTLTTAFPFDDVAAVRTGVRGADVVQTVMTRSGAACGKIIWETKRAENWSNNWIPKLKDDQQSANAEIAALVSTTFPADADAGAPFAQYDGVWLVRPFAVRPVAEALRTVLIESQKQKAVSVGKGEKMEALYDYVCSPRFAQKVRGVVDAYNAMREDLEREKAAMSRLWKKREMQLERLTTNMMGMCGELQGIAENALPQLESIGQLPYEPEET